jgi:diacylglycerol kinase
MPTTTPRPYEELWDYVQPERTPQIGATMDIAAAAVSICMGAWVIVMLIEGCRLLLARA